eukprot:TRINITY_DN2460_c0_g1_i1.p1 TRINITY_DN2460_c0_g1~~TRINITY_DN2460_c0_g1_i1.p1  ORF type:complete len:532 (+),score=69.97 TRINITY_DN2460_c0_g1_i1:159-1598(+)
MAKIWGWTQKAGAQVILTFNGESFTTNSSSSDNSWSISLPPTLAGGPPYSIDIKSSDGETASLTNILFGDVWICSGQSNMQFTVSDVFNASEAIADAQNYPNIRIFTVGQATISQTPLENFATIEQNWTVASSASVGGADWTFFSATCWFYGVQLSKTYDIPIGLISTNWGGTYIQAWSSPAANAVCNQDEDFEVPKDQQKMSSIKRQLNPNQPSVLWNAMVVPLLNMRVKGAIWYQAEANVGQDQYYACAFPAMILDWRSSFGYSIAADFPFLFVQLAPYTEGNPPFPQLPQMRLAQTAALSLPSVGMACTVDLGDPLSPEGNIHPRDKMTVGYRLSLAARAIAYGEAIQYTGPTPFFISGTSDGDGTIRALINYEYGSVGSGLVLQTAVCPPLINTTNCGWAELQTTDGNWHPASIGFGQQNEMFFITKVAETGAQWAGARYLYNDYPAPMIFNKEGLPAVPFYYSTIDTNSKMTRN